MGATFCLKGEDGAECFEGAESFKYSGRFLHPSDKDWPAVLRNTWRSRQILGVVREVADDRGSGPNHIRKFIPCGGPYGATLCVGNLGVDGRNDTKTRWDKSEFPAVGDRDEESKAGGRELAKLGVI